MTRRSFASLALTIFFALPMTGCRVFRNASQYPTPGCPHPVAYVYERVDDIRDGIAIEYGQVRVEDDVTEYRLGLAKDHAVTKTARANHRLRKFLYGPKPWWLP